MTSRRRFAASPVWLTVAVLAFLAKLVSRDCAVIRVLLPKAGGKPELPVFVKTKF